MASSKRPKWSFLNFYIELRMKPMGVGLKLALLIENEFFFLKGIIIVHELEIKDYQHQIFNT